MFDHIPVGVGSKGIIPMTARDLEEALEMGMDWSLREGKKISLFLAQSTLGTIIPVIYKQQIQNDHSTFTK